MALRGYGAALDSITGLINNIPPVYASAHPHLPRDSIAASMCHPLLQQTYTPVLTGHTGRSPWVWDNDRHLYALSILFNRPIISYVSFYRPSSIGSILVYIILSSTNLNRSAGSAPVSVAGRFLLGCHLCQPLRKMYMSNKVKPGKEGTL